MVDFHCLSIEESAYLEVFFDSEILPLLSPTIVGKRQLFPFLKISDASYKKCRYWCRCTLWRRSGWYDCKNTLQLSGSWYQTGVPQLCTAGSVFCVPASGLSPYQTGVQKQVRKPISESKWTRSRTKRSSINWSTHQRRVWKLTW